MGNKQYKVIAVGDTHGRNKWKQIIEQNKDADKIIFLGDYFDSFDIPFSEQMSNFVEILVLKKKQPDKVILLMGNHDYQYMTAYSSDRYSGYQPHYADKIEEVLEQAIKEDLIKIIHMEDNFLFSHAGVTKTWLEDNKLDKGGVVAQINFAFKNTPEIFKFTPSTPFDNVGDSITQGPIWVRPRALLSDKIDGVKQVVGHTHQKCIDVSGDVIFIDTLEPLIVYKDNRDEYLKIINNIPQVGKIYEKK